MCWTTFCVFTSIGVCLVAGAPGDALERGFPKTEDPVVVVATVQSIEPRFYTDRHGNEICIGIATLKVWSTVYASEEIQDNTVMIRNMVYRSGADIRFDASFDEPWIVPQDNIVAVLGKSIVPKGAKTGTLFDNKREITFVRWFEPFDSTYSANATVFNRDGSLPELDSSGGEENPMYALRFHADRRIEENTNLGDLAEQLHSFYSARSPER